MKVIIYTYDDAEYEKLSHLVENFDQSTEKVRAPLDGHKFYHKRYDIVIVALEGAEGMEVVIEYSQRYKDSEVIWITSDDHFAGTAMRAHIFDFIKRPYDDERIKQSISEAVKASPARNQWSIGGPE